jgi:hypothetical protein
MRKGFEQRASRAVTSSRGNVGFCDWTRDDVTDASFPNPTTQHSRLYTSWALTRWRPRTLVRKVYLCKSRRVRFPSLRNGSALTRCPDEAAVYDRQIRLWGLEAQQR